MSRLTANLFMSILKNRDVWRGAYEEALCEIAGRAKMSSLVSSQRALFINDKLYTIIDTTPADAIIVTKGLLWIGGN